MKFALTGTPIAHSKNPKMFAAAYHGKHSYELMPASTAEEALRLFHEKGMDGMNVTMPLKAAVIPYMDELDDTVRLLNAANVVVRRDGKLKAYNTDVFGVSGALEAAGLSLSGVSCLVVGGGGAARAAVAALHKAGAEVTIANRTIEKAEAIAALFGAGTQPLAQALHTASSYKVLVNCIPASAGALQQLQLQAGQVVLDADYAHKPLLALSGAVGALYVDGLQWLLHQAFPAYRLFTGEEPDIPAMINALHDSTL